MEREGRWRIKGGVLFFCRAEMGQRCLYVRCEFEAGHYWEPDGYDILKNAMLVVVNTVSLRNRRAEQAGRPMRSFQNFPRLPYLFDRAAIVARALIERKKRAGDKDVCCFDDRGYFDIYHVARSFISGSSVCVS